MSKHKKDKKIKELTEQIEKYEKIIGKLLTQLKDKKIHNERGAGRKPKFTDVEIEAIKKYRLEGSTIKEIASMFECSTGLIHKLIHSQ